MKLEPDDLDETVVALDPYNSDLNLVLSASRYTAHPLTNEGFAFMWAGVRATHGFAKGKVCFEVKIVEHLNVAHLPADEPNPHVVRVGFSAESATLQLGEDPLSYGYGGTGKISTNCQFKDFGGPFMSGDVITAFLNMESDTVQIGYAKNGRHLGWAYRVNKKDLKGQALFPHILTKNVSFEVNFGQKDKPYFPLPDSTKDFTFVNCTPMDHRVNGTRAPKKQECEMIMMCGIPGAGKSFWAADYSLKHPDKKYNILGTNNIIDKMKVMGLPRKRNYHGRWDVLIKMATNCLNKMFEIGSKLRRNYILDQTNVYPTAQRRKMRNFEGFKRIAVVVVPSEAEYKRRCDKRDREEGKEVPDSAVNEMKANFKIPEKNDIFDDVIFTDLQRDEAEKLVKIYNEEGRAATGPPRKQFRPNEPSGFGNRGNFNQGGPPGRSGRGGYESNSPRQDSPGRFGGDRGGFGSNRNEFDGNRGGNDNYGGYGGGRGGFGGNRGGRDGNRGGFDGGREGFDGPPGGFDGGRGYDDRRGYDGNRGGSGGNRGRYDGNRGGPGGNRGGYDDNRSGPGGSRGGGFDSGRGGFGGNRGGYDGGRSGYGGNRGGYDGGRGGYGGNRGGFDGNRGDYDSNQKGYDSNQGYESNYGDYDGGQRGFEGRRGGGYQSSRGGFDEGRGQKRGFDDGRFDQSPSRGSPGGYDNNSQGNYGGDSSGYGSNRGFGSSRGGRGRGDFGRSSGSQGGNNYSSNNPSDQYSGRYGQDTDSGSYDKDSSYGSGQRGRGGQNRGGPRGGSQRGGNTNPRGGYGNSGGRGGYGGNDYGRDSSSSYGQSASYGGSSGGAGYGGDYQNEYSSQAQGGYRSSSDTYPKRDMGYGSTPQGGFKKEPGTESGGYDTGSGLSQNTTRPSGKTSRWSAEPAQSQSYTPRTAPTQDSMPSYPKYGAQVKTEPASTTGYESYSTQASSYASYGQTAQPTQGYPPAAQTYSYQQQSAAPASQWATPAAPAVAAAPTTPAVPAAADQSQWSQYYQQPAQANQYYSQYYGQPAAGSNPGY